MYISKPMQTSHVTKITRSCKDTFVAKTAKMNARQSNKALRVR